MPQLQLQTIFPESPEGKHQKAWDNVNSCTRGKLAVRPRKGDAVLFYAMSTDGIESPGSLHGSCDVVNGTKFSAPVWIRQAPFHVADLPPEGAPSLSRPRL
jgi:prolyl 4-hydroxylase